MPFKKYSHIKRKLAVRRSSAGLGLFAEEPIERGGFVIEYRGNVISSGQADERGGKYLFDINDKKTIDGSPRWNTARYANHSCRPNCEAKVIRGKVLLFAKRKIKAGEELVYDYEKEYFNAYIKPHGCRCGKCASKKSKGLWGRAPEY